jgi:hypothetical protein
MFNMLNSRKIGNELNVVSGIFRSHVFWVIWVLICIFQVCNGWWRGGWRGCGWLAGG